MSARARPRPRARSILVWPAVMTVAMLAVLLALGVWQVRRLAWKTALLDAIDRAEAAPPIPLPAHPSPFAKVAVRGHFVAGKEVLYGVAVRQTGRGPQLGADLLVPLEPGNGPPVLVDRGWIPQTREKAIPAPAGDVSVTGFVRPPEQAGLFSARDDPAGRRFYTLDPAAIGAAIGLPNLAPFTLVALGPPPPQLYPDPARALPRPPNNHLSYAITWFGLAAVLVVMFAIWARKAMRT